MAAQAARGASGLIGPGNVAYQSLGHFRLVGGGFQFIFLRSVPPDDGRDSPPRGRSAR